MTRRRASARRARWLLAASALAGGGIYGWTHITWLSTSTTVAVWVLYAALKLARRHRPHHHRRPTPRPRPTPSPTYSVLEHTQHVLYYAYNRAGQLIYIGICVVHDGRDVLDRINEHMDTQGWWRTDVARVHATDYYPSRTLALAAEATAIHAAIDHGALLYNRTHIGHPAADCPTIAAARADPTWPTP